MMDNMAGSQYYINQIQLPMKQVKKFLRGYMQTMLFGIEQRPTYKMEPSFYLLLHLINHFQYIAIIIQAYHDRPYTDFKIEYSKSFMEFFILNNLLKSSMNYALALAIIILSFLSQVLLFFFLSFSTVIRIWTANLTKRDASMSTNTKIQQWVMSFNENLHWLFVVYPVVYLQIAVISFSSLRCNSLSLIPYKECEISGGIQFLAIVPLIISFIHGQILIYIMRNHRFNETNSLKRRYSGILLLNNAIILVEVFAHYIYEFNGADYLKYVSAAIFAFDQIIDQLSNFPYRDPIRVPAIRIAFGFCWIVLVLCFYRFIGFEEEYLFFMIVVPLPIFGIIGEAASTQFQYHAILNYNSDSQIEEKHIIIAVDQFYRLFQDYLKSPESQIQYLQFIMIHRLYCKNSKCYSKFKRFVTLDLDQKKDLMRLTLSVIKCIFKTAQTWLFSMQRIDLDFHRHNTNSDLQFEQLQLQFISFVSEVAQKPLIGYIELRQYQNNKLNNNSIYFIEITNKLSEQLQKLIIDNQIRQNQNTLLIHEQRTQLSEISLAQQWQTQNLYENMLQAYLKLIDAKIEHWQNLMNGYPNLNPFQYNTQLLCEKLHFLKDELDRHIGVPEEWFDIKSTSLKGVQVKKMTHAELNINVVTLKLYSLFYSLMMNDFDRTAYIEQYIKDLTSNDRQKEVDIIDNISLINDMTSILLVSLVKNKGKIVNKNQLALANFFHYIDANDFKDTILTVHNLLPKQMIKSHEMLIDQFIQTGHSDYFVKKISGYYENREGFLEKGYVKLGNLFEELDDYVLTASVLKCNISNQIILVDQEGKVIGMSQEFYKLLKMKIPELEIDFMKEVFNFFLILPQFIWIIKQNLDKLDQKEHLALDDEEILFYVPNDLIQLNQLFMKQQYERLGHKFNQTFDSQNLSSWRSFRSLSKSLKLESKDKTASTGLALMDKDNMNFHYEFLQQQKKSLQDYFIVRARAKLHLSQMRVKSHKYPYFIFSLDHIFELDQSHKHFTKYPSFEQSVEYAMTMLQSQQYNKQGVQDTIMDSFDQFHSTKNQSFELQASTTNNKVAQKAKKPNQAPVDHEKIRQLIIQDDSQILLGHQDDSQLRFLNQTFELQNNQTFERQQILRMPLKKDLDDDQDEMVALDEHFASLHVPAISGDAAISNDELRKQEDDREESQLDLQAQRGKQSSSGHNQMQKNDLLELLKQNRKLREGQGDHENDEEEAKKRSVASSSRTSTSKSPSLLVRSLYSLGAFQGGVKIVAIIIIIFLCLQFSLIFIKMSLIQNNYDNLQININFVTFPETLNYYFLKTTMISLIGLQQKLRVMTYSEFIQNENEKELIVIREEIDVKLRELYQGIIQYEGQILNDKIKLVSINKLSSYEQNLDLTQLIQQIQLHAFSYIDNHGSLSETIISDSLFFRLNVPYVYSFAYEYITLLNNNLIYYEDKIINDVVILTMTFLGIYTLILGYLLYATNNITLYERSILMLITRVSARVADDTIQTLLNSKAVLIEPSQLLWKRVNYFDLTYDALASNELNSKLISKSNKGSVTSNPNEATKQSKQKSKKSYSSNSLAQRIYDLTLVNYTNYIALLSVWLLAVLFVVGAILVTITQVSDIKPTLNLNLQLIRFKLRYDSLVVQGEILKTQSLIEKQLAEEIKGYEIDFKINQILDLFNIQGEGLQDAMAAIYDSLAGDSGLLETQKKELLNYFENNLCLFMLAEIPFCEVKISSDASFAVPESFVQKYGKPYPQDNNYEYISGGIINTVQEFAKTLQTNFAKEKQYRELESEERVIREFLNTTVHVNQFIEYFLDNGKLFTKIGNNLFQQNQSKLSQATTIMQLYIYITGIGIILLLLMITYIWLKYMSRRLKMMRLSLTLIPYEVLIEPKTMSFLKQL